MTDQAVQPTGTATGPTGPHTFTGRDRELRALRDDIGRAGLHTLSGHPPAHSRVLLIAGAPGSGRTALAEEFVRRHAGRYPGGVFRARLTDPGGVPVSTERAARDLLAALGITGTPPAGCDEDDLCDAVRSALTASAPLVLLLDDVAHSDQVLDLLPESRECLVVAVSSGPLTGVPDVRPCTLGGLDRAAAVELLARRVGSAPRVTVDPRSAEALAEACGDLPAALALMGGWLGARPKLSVADATKQLGEQPEPPREAAAEQEQQSHPQQSHPQRQPPGPLARAFRLVHGSLAPTPARMLRLLALAPAGFADPQTASALAGCSVGVARSALEEFVRLGLLRALGAECYEVPGCLDPLLRAELEKHERPAQALLARARMLERTVRQLQACRAVCEPSGSEARKRMAGMPRSLRFAHPAEARAWLEVRRPAMLAATRMAVADGDGELDTLARRLVSALGRAFEAHREPDEAAPELYRLHELVLAVAERGALHRERAAALLNLGDLDARTDRLDGALGRYRAALDAARAGKDPLAAGRSLESLGGTYAELGDWARAADWYGRALALRLTRGERADREAVARLHGRIGAVHTYAGHWDEALRAWRAAAAAFRRLREPAAHARALAEAARVQEYADRPHDSLRTCGQALEAARRAGDRRLEAALRLRLADACRRVGDLRAERAHRAAANLLLTEAERPDAEAPGDAGERREPGEPEAEDRRTAEGGAAGADGA
ncbi:tetratricopeptide repeat protein [Streptomyces iconiensis]|uniref:Tetratricopeptide repeat protein n=1 Tax=Streptomyces iconiensis TaxID=1384038 RepID=A0ABT7A5Z6_9ACTN|nr:tetratricopeptide repeat protein [Streptomyces iconiensis]MDJ1136740.1 tetratricopeptide repeat protein [Streptomyces iconiensis]